MVNLPRLPVRETYISEDDPFVKEALRPRKPFEPCWCGSGLKYKKCHRFRETHAAPTVGEVLHQTNQLMWKARNCMHPEAPAHCRGKVIDSHSIQRKGALGRIVDETNHVCRFVGTQEADGLDVDVIGWRKASVFPGFCSYHDSSLFSELETRPFDGDHRQCVLQSFRNVCNELYRKRALVETLELQRQLVDSGKDLDTQISIQMGMLKSIEGSKKSEEELFGLWKLFNKALAMNELDRFSSRVFFFEGDVSVVSSAVFQVEFDFHGHQLADLWDLSIDADMISHSLMETNDGGAIVFCWPSHNSNAERLVRTFEELDNCDKGDIFVQYCFLNSENTYFSKKWWESLEQSQREYVKQLFRAFYYDGGAFEASPSKLVEWKIHG